MVWEISNDGRYSWGASIRRAEHLAAQADATRELLTFYAALLRAQKEVYDFLRGREGWLPSGVLEDDLAVVGRTLPGLLGAVEACGPEALREEARVLARAGEDEVRGMILEEWRAPSGTQFFAKALLQPYARWLAESGGRPFGREPEGGRGRCPFCGGRAQVSLLRTREPSADGGGRELLCATCLTAWPFGRVLCVNCGEQRPAMLGYFHTQAYDHMRVEACDACRHYIKGVDLTRLGLAVPLVDEVAAAPLDLWAQEHGYTKIELNLVGL